MAQRIGSVRNNSPPLAWSAGWQRWAGWAGWAGWLAGRVRVKEFGVDYVFLSCVVYSVLCFYIALLTV